MKNIFLTLAFIFIASAFTPSAKQNKEFSGVPACAQVTLSCGLTGHVCGVTTAEIKNVLWAENHFCAQQ